MDPRRIFNGIIQGHPYEGLCKINCFKNNHTKDYAKKFIIGIKSRFI
jgi:hypothetical protein